MPHRPKLLPIPCAGELERLKQYRKKVNRVTAADELSRARPTVSLNIAAANRFISHAMPSFSDDQAERLRLMTQIYKQKTADEEAQKATEAAAAAAGGSKSRKAQASSSAAAAQQPQRGLRQPAPAAKKPRRSAAADAADFLTLIAETSAVEDAGLGGGSGAEAAAAAKALTSL